MSAVRTNGNATTWKFGSAILIITALLVLIAVLAIAGLALWMGGRWKLEVLPFVSFFSDAGNADFFPLVQFPLWELVRSTKLTLLSKNFGLMKIIM